MRSQPWLVLSLTAAVLLMSTRLPASVPPPNGPGKALQFDGANDYFSVPHAVDLNALPLTISAWVKASRNAALVDGIISKYTDASYNGYSLYLYNGHVCGFYFRDVNNRVFTSVLGLDGGFVADGAWHHVALVADAARGANRGGRGRPRLSAMVGSEWTRPARTADDHGSASDRSLLQLRQRVRGADR